jgi:CRP/FNR family transcriptional regulator
MVECPAPVRRLGRERRLAAGASLFQAEEAASAFYYLLQGQVRVFKLDGQGREMEVTRLGAGDFVGEAFALVGGRYPFFAQAVREARVLELPAAAVDRAIASDPAAARFFVRLLARKCVSLSGRVESLAMRTVPQRLAEFLLGRCGGAGGCRVDLPMSKGELAMSLGTVSETLSRALGRMSRRGLIEVRGPAIRILDCAGLKGLLDRAF